MKIFERDWGQEAYYYHIEDVLNSIRNDRIKKKIYTMHMSYVPITKEEFFVVRRSKRGFILGVYRIHDTIPIFPLYEPNSKLTLSIDS